MDNRFNPYDSPRQQQRQALNNAQIQAAMEMEEAIYIQRQHELQRDLQLRQLLLQEQLDHQHLLQNPISSLHQQRLFELQQYAGQHSLASLHEEQLLLQQQEQLRRRQLQQQLHPHLNLSSGMSNASHRDYAAEALVADTLAANSARRANVTRKRSFDRVADDGDMPPSKRPAARKDGGKKDKASAVLLANESLDELDIQSPKKPKGKPRGRAAAAAKKAPARAKLIVNEPAIVLTIPANISDPGTMEAVEALMGGPDLTAHEDHESVTPESESDEPPIIRGTVESLIEAAEAEEKVDDAASLMVGLKNVEWPDSESEVDSKEAPTVNGNYIVLPGFKSSLPALPIEPEYDMVSDAADGGTNGVVDGFQADVAENGGSHPPTSQLNGDPNDSSNMAKPKKGAPIPPTEYPYPIDTWWPSITTIRRERRMRGEKSDEEDFADDSSLANEDTPFRADLATIRSRLANEVEPGVLEKIPHCKIHRQRIKLQKGANTPDHAFCWQITESYCNDVMVCCSICSTWRHAACGGHYKPYSIRDCIQSDTPFTPICDLCHEESEIVLPFLKGRRRLERQRIEQLRRAMATSAVIRQASFAKHGGTYKWPLGSVSSTHIGGHTRSVHSRHDKAEKQWAEMAMRLGRGYGYRPKERIKVRTRELERLLVSVEDSEGVTDRHNMMQFLLHDTRQENPAGFDKRRRNLFDPDDDSAGGTITTRALDTTAISTIPESDLEPRFGRKAPSANQREDEVDSPETEEAPTQCVRNGCARKPRFDSAFCSDACGVSGLESDLLRALEYAGDIHPALLRS